MDNQQRNYSIIVVTYNNANGLRRTLQSIRQLDYTHKEVVVIDGGSKDDSLSVIAENQDIITTSVSEKDSNALIVSSLSIGMNSITEESWFS